MSTETVTPIATYFRVHDGLRIRFADNRADSDTTVLMLAPWPESVWAFRRIWGACVRGRPRGRYRSARLRSSPA